MNWLTLTQINEAAKTSDKTALECSRLHWEQIATCTQEEWNKGFERNRVHLGIKRCSCCMRYYDRLEESCTICPLRGWDSTANSCCKEAYGVAESYGDDYDGHPDDFEAFQTAAKAVERYIAAKIEEIA